MRKCLGIWVKSRPYTFAESKKSFEPGFELAKLIHLLVPDFRMASDEAWVDKALLLLSLMSHASCDTWIPKSSSA